MGKHNMLAAPPRRPWKIHPIWRGIGCLIVLIGPVIAYAGASVLLNLNSEFGWTVMPASLMKPVYIRSLNVTVDHLWATLILAGVLLLLGYALIISIYGIFYSIMGPPRYSPLDADPHKDVYRRQRR